MKQFLNERIYYESSMIFLSTLLCKDLRKQFFSLKIHKSLMVHIKSILIGKK